MEPADPVEAALEVISGRLSALERRIDAIEQTITAPAATAVAAAPAIPPPPAPIPPPPPSPTPTLTRASTPTRASAAELAPPPRPANQPTITKTHGAPTTSRPELSIELVLRWAGVALTVLAAIFFVASAIDRGWLTPELQLLGAAIAGLALLASALVVDKARRQWARALAIGGAVVIVICAGASYGWLKLWDPITALALVAMASASAVTVGWRLRMESVAIAAVMTALLVPAWASILSDSPVFVVGLWLAILAVAGSIIGLERRWPTFRLASVWSIAVGVAALAGLLFADGNSDYALPGAALVAIVAVTLWTPAGRSAVDYPIDDPVARPSTTGVNELLRGLELRSAMAVPVWTWYSLLLFAGLILDGGGLNDQGTRIETSGGIIGLALAGGFGGMAMLVEWRDGRRTGSTVAVSHLLGAGLLAAVVIVVWLGGPVATLALAVQGLATVVLARRIGPPAVRSDPTGWNLLYLQGLGVAGLASAMLIASLVSELSGEIDGTTTRAADGLAHGLVAVALVGVAWLVDRDHQHRAAPAWSVAWASVAVCSTWAVDPLLEPLLGSRRWLITGTVIALVGLALAARIGFWVTVQSASVLAVTLVMAGYVIVSSIVDQPTWADHLSTLATLVGGAAVATALWRRARSGIDATADIDGRPGGQTNAVGRTAAPHRLGGDPDLARLLTAAVWLLALGWIAAVLLDRLEGSAGQVALSLAWAAAACAAIVVSVVGRNPVGPGGDVVVRSIGLGTLFVVLGKLLTVDLAAVDTLWRVGLFLVVGLALLRLGYVLPRLAERFGRLPAG